MAIERKWETIPPRTFVSDGTSTGQITLSSTSKLRVKQNIIVKATGEEALSLEIKRVLSKTQLLVGPTGAINLRSDLTLYTTAKAATLEAPEQFRPAIPDKEYDRAKFEEEPVVAERVYLVDEIGEPFDEDNPFPVLATVSDNAPQNRYSFRVPYPSATIEQSQLLPNNTKKLYIAISDLSAKLRIDFTPNGTITETGNTFTTVHVGNSYCREGLKLIGKTLYFQANRDNLVIEIEAWV